MEDRPKCDVPKCGEEAWYTDGDKNLCERHRKLEVHQANKNTLDNFFFRKF